MDRLRKITFIFNSFAFLVLILVDQLSKYLIRLKGGFYICNPNISWNLPVSGYFFWIILGIAIFSLLILLIRNKKDLLPIVIILAGAFSNVFDRIVFGCVIDFIQLPFWPMFNLADVFIFLGTIFLLVRWIKS